MNQVWVSYRLRWLTPVFVAVLTWLIPGSATAQVSPALYDYVRSDLDWYTIETEHFLIHFHADESGSGSNRTARVVSQIAEDIYAPITSLYNYEPDTKVSIVLKDFEDYSNGAAYFFDNIIEIWAPALDTPYRGSHNWLRNVITHEFTHIVQVQKSMKGTRRVPFYYLQLLDYEDVRRPDVLYGFPNVIATYPIPVLNNPAWFAEGTAQYQRQWMNYDHWDTHRDMLLRTRVLAGEELSLADMGSFYSHTSLMREGVYNQGFAFTSYIANRFGEDALTSVTEELGKWTNWNFESAAKDALGISGDQLYEEWISSLRDAYMAGTEEIRRNESSGSVLVEKGFNNFYPRFSPDGATIAYVSNQGEDYSRTRIHLLDLDAGSETVLELPGLAQPARLGLTRSFEHVLTKPVSGAIDWHPDGKSIVYARIRDTKFGHLYSDLYSIEISTETETRLTTELRARSPSYSPDGSTIAFIGERDGSANLFLLDVNTKEVTPVTEFQDGTQVSEPVWHPGGDWIYAGLSRDANRDIIRIRTSGGDMEPVVADPAVDERSPAFDNTGVLYFSSDRTGIYNLYRSSSADRLEFAAEQLTNELGGAFTPHLSSTGQVTYSRYTATGYQVALLTDPIDLPAASGGIAYSPPAITLKGKSRPPEGLHVDPVDVDADVRAYPVTSFKQDAELRPYDDVFTSFSFLPVLRLDQYVSRRRSRTEVRLKDRSRAETLWRNLKLGMYTASREILGGLSMFGAVLIAPGSTSPGSLGSFFSPSNLLDLERDLFLQFDYNKGLGFVKARWSPQISLELFNIRRNVENGLAIDEFPCTACYPDTTLADLSYNLWEVNLSARSKINRSLLIEAGYRYSPYQVTTERFFSKELRGAVPESSSKYFIGHGPRIKAYFESFHPYRDADVVPHGLRVEAGFELEQGKLLERFTIENGFLKPVYEKSQIYRYSFDGRLGYRLTESGRSGGAYGVGFRIRQSSILGDPVDKFYDDYVGGLAGARGYPFYALGGNKTLWTQLSVTFPIAARIKKQILFTYIDKIYARIYGDAALAWTGSWPGLGNARKDIGAEIRLGLGSYYLLPTAVFVSATYGIDTFEFNLDEGFVTPSGSKSIQYGNELLWHAGVLFGFDLF
ncbi:MAG: hypothetical protein BMS9Abin05_0897 [Rhodothermia bacterium]|nr:MAG: hypothetical protein BMS9Abin05_0897 [Rhodothermia bacterium]